MARFLAFFTLFHLSSTFFRPEVPFNCTHVTCVLGIPLQVPLALSFEIRFHASGSRGRIPLARVTIVQLPAIDWLVTVDRLLTMPPISSSCCILLIRISLKGS